MKLNDWIKFRSYSDHTVVYDTRRNTKTIFNGIVFSILEFLKHEVSFEEIVDGILEMYDLDNAVRKSVENDITSLLSTMIENGMVKHSHNSDFDNAVDADKMLIELCEENKQLEHVYFELTYRCNQQCIHCYEDHKEKCNELSFSELCTLLDELREMGVLELTFTGGEVAVREDFISLCSYASLLGFAVHIYTNGIAFSDKQISELCEMNIADIAFSVYSMDADIHDAVTKVPGSFNRTMRTLFAFKSAGIRTIIKTVVIKQNEEGFTRLVDFAKLMRIPLETSMQVLATNPMDLRIKEHRLADEEAYYKNMLYEARAFGYAVGGDNCYSEKRTRVCGLGRCLNVAPDGTVYPCNVLPIALGNIRDQSIAQIWKKPQIEALRRFGICDMEEECQRCDYLNYCLYCPGALLRETGTMNKHTSDTCLLAHAKKRVFDDMNESNYGGGENHEEV